MTSFATENFNVGTQGSDLVGQPATFGGDWVDGSSSGSPSPVYWGNRCRQQDAPTAIAYVDVTPPSADYAVQAPVDPESGGSGGVAGVVGRKSAGAGSANLTCYIADYYDHATAGSRQWRLYAYVAGSYTPLGDYTENIGTTAKVLKLEMIGSAIKVYVDGVERISATDSSVTAAGHPGVIFGAASSPSTNAVFLDDWEAFDVPVAKPGTDTATGTDASSVSVTDAPVAKSASDTAAASDVSGTAYDVSVNVLFGGTEDAAAADAASVNILSSSIPKSAADAGVAADAASVAASVPTVKAGADSASAADTSVVTEIEAPVVVQAGSYDLRLGRIRLPTLLDQQKETVGEQLETVGATAIAGERRAKASPLAIPVHATGNDGKTVADRMRRQVRALLNNPAARLGALYLAFDPDPELSGWMLIGAGDLEYSDGGIVFGDYKLALSDAYVVGRQRSHVAARRIEVHDRRLATTPRDTKGTLFSTDFAAITPSAVAFLPGATRYLRRGGPWPGTPVASVSGLMGPGTPQLVPALVDGDVIVLDGVPSDTQLQSAELGDVIVLDRQGVAATGVTAARDVTPQPSYGWEELYGPDQPVSYPSGAPADLVMQNGVCRVSVSSTGVFTVEWMTSAGFSPACTVTPINDALPPSLQLRDANIVHWTPDETVVRFQLDNTQIGLSESAVRCEMYVTLRRGWDAPRFEAYANYALTTGRIRLRVLHATGGTTALDTSTTGPSNITDDTDYGNFSARDPWLGLSPSSGPVILAAVTRTTDKIRGRVVGALKGIELYDPTARSISYASAQLSVTTAGVASSLGPVHAQRCMVDVRTIPTLLPR